MTVLIIDVDPFLTAPAFHPDAVYRINIDTDGDVPADVAFTVTFSAFEDGAQTGTVYYATGADADADFRMAACSPTTCTACGSPG